MKPFIIVTVKSEQLSEAYDLELPTDVLVSTLIDNIQETLYDYKSIVLGISNLYCERMKKSLQKDRTLSDQGVWNGDILFLK